jgi:hypothetical protein
MRFKLANPAAAAKLNYAKAAVNAPQSRRWRDCRGSSNFAKRLDCGAFTAAFPHDI